MHRVPANNATSQVEDQCFTVNNLQPWTLYRVKVRAATAAGPGPFSDELQVRTQESGTSVVLFIGLAGGQVEHTNDQIFITFFQAV